MVDVFGFRGLLSPHDVQSSKFGGPGWLRYNFKNIMMWQRDLMLEALKMLMQLET